MYSRNREEAVLDYLVAEGYDTQWIQVFADKNQIPIPSQPSHTLKKNFYSIMKLQKRVMDVQKASRVKEIPKQRLDFCASRVHSRPITCLASKDSWLLSGDELGVIALWDVESEVKLLETFSIQKSRIQSLCWASNGNRFASTCQDCHISIWAQVTESHFDVLLTLNGHMDIVLDLYFPFADSTIYSAGKDGSVLEWDIQAIHYPKMNGEFSHPHWVRSIDGNSKKSILATACNQSIYIWDMGLKKTRHILNGHGHIIQQVKFKDETVLISCSRDNDILLWDTENGCKLQVLSHHHNWVSKIMIVEQEWLVSVGQDGCVFLWDLGTEKVLASFRVEQPLQTLAVFKNGRILSSLESNLLVWKS